MMKMIRLFILILVIAGTQVWAQQSKPLQFKEETFDFGAVAEEGGPVTHEFVFTNGSTRPVKVLTVQASCGCTTPGWSKEPVAPGKTGYIQASFNPKGRPGFFTKSLTVTTDLEATPIVLQIKGQVNTGGSATPSDFHIANGNWKLKAGSFNLGKVYRKDEFTTRDFQVLNGGNKAITFSGKFVGPAYIKVDVTPKVLAPGAKGNIKISYNGKLKNAYGFQSDNVEIQTDDESNPVKSFSVYATLEDYFEPLKPEELSKAPQLRLGMTSLDFGTVSSAGATREITVTNNGKKELNIRSLQGNCTCVTASATKPTLKPGESSTIKVNFKPQDRKGTQQKAVTIYSNDPRNPVQRVTFSAYVD
jgi:archaellum component FlaF (FlaF/FlaG flagellin family)